MHKRHRIHKQGLFRKFFNSEAKVVNIDFFRSLIRSGSDSDKATPTTGTDNKISTYIIIGLIVVFAISLFRNIANVRQVEKKISDKATEVEKLKEEEQKLQKDLEYTKSQEFVEKQLRDKLGLAKEDEIVVVMPPPEIVRKFAPKYNAEEVIFPDPNWKKWVKLFI